MKIFFICGNLYFPPVLFIIDFALSYINGKLINYPISEGMFFLISQFCLIVIPITVFGRIDGAVFNISVVCSFFFIFFIKIFEFNFILMN